MAKGKMKAWYDDIDAATLQRIKTYSAFNDATSKNLMMQTMYEYREKEIQDFKETNHELAETCIARKKRIDELEKANEMQALRIKECNELLLELKAQIEKMKCCGNCNHFNYSEPNYCHKGVYRERQYVCSEWEFGN